MAGEVRRELKGIADIERIAGRIALRNARPRDLASLRESLARLTTLRAPLAGNHSPLLGALEREVLMQFLVGAVVLPSSGGLFGILLGLGASFGLKNLLQVPFVFNPGIAIIAFLFSAAVGVLFGYFPALKAARLDPIEALRHE